MAHALYMDHSVKGAIVRGLRRRGLDVLTAQEDDNNEASDPQVMDRAMELERVVFAQDIDFVIEGERRQAEGIPFYGVIYAHPDKVPIGTCIEDIHILAELEDLDNLKGRVKRLPL